MKRIAATVIALSMFSASAVMAKDHRDWGRDQRHTSQHRDSRHSDDHRRDHDRDRRSDSRNHHFNRNDHDYRHRNYYSGSNRGGYSGSRYPRFHAPEYRHPYGYRDSRWSDYRWHRGDRLPRVYCDRGYWVTHYSYYRLRPPPYGYHWVRVNNDVLLTALATGIVLDAVYDHFW